MESGSVPKPIEGYNPFRWHLWGRKDIMYLKKLKINPDPRVIKYNSLELISYLRKGYEIMSEGQEYILLACNAITVAKIT